MDKRQVNFNGVRCVLTGGPVSRDTLWRVTGPLFTEFERENVQALPQYHKQFSLPTGEYIKLSNLFGAKQAFISAPPRVIEAEKRKVIEEVLESRTLCAFEVFADPHNCYSGPYVCYEQPPCGIVVCFGKGFQGPYRYYGYDKFKAPQNFFSESYFYTEHPIFNWGHTEVYDSDKTAIAFEASGANAVERIIYLPPNGVAAFPDETVFSVSYPHGFGADWQYWMYDYYSYIDDVGNFATFYWYQYIYTPWNSHCIFEVNGNIVTEKVYADSSYGEMYGTHPRLYKTGDKNIALWGYREHEKSAYCDAYGLYYDIDSNEMICTKIGEDVSGTFRGVGYHNALLSVDKLIHDPGIPLWTLNRGYPPLHVRLVQYEKLIEIESER